MLEKITIARPYAQAAFEFAREQGDVAHWSGMLKLLRAIIANARMRPLLHDPRISDAQLYELVASIAGDSLSENGGNFVRILIRSERLQFMPEIADLYEAMLARAEGRVDVSTPGVMRKSSHLICLVWHRATRQFLDQALGFGFTEGVVPGTTRPC